MKKETGFTKEDKELINVDNYGSISTKYRKPNVIVKSFYNMSLYGQRIYAYTIYKLERAIQSGSEFQYLEIDLKELEDIKFITHGGNSREVLSTVIGELKYAYAYIEDHKNKISRYGVLFPTCDYIRETKKLRIWVNQQIFEYMKYLETYYTIYELETLASLNSAYAFRLYEILKSEAYERNRIVPDYIVPLSKLRFMMGTSLMDSNVEKYLVKNPNDYDGAMTKSKENKYALWTDFRRQILNPAVNKINSETDLNVSFKYAKRGNNLKKDIIFHIDFKNIDNKHSRKTRLYDDFKTETAGNNIIMMSECIEKLRKSIDGFTEKQLHTLAADADYNAEIVLEKYRLMTQYRHLKIDNKMGWMRQAIRDDWCQTECRTQKNSFYAAERCDYDFEQIERQILSN